MSKLKILTEEDKVVYVENIETKNVGQFVIHKMLPEYHDELYHPQKIYAITHEITGVLFCQHLTQKAADELCREIERNIKTIQPQKLKSTSKPVEYLKEAYNKVTYDKIRTIRAKYLG